MSFATIHEVQDMLAEINDIAKEHGTGGCEGLYVQITDDGLYEVISDTSLANDNDLAMADMIVYENGWEDLR